MYFLFFLLYFFVYFFLVFDEELFCVCCFFFFFFFFFFVDGWDCLWGVFFLDFSSVVLVSLSFLICYLMYLASNRIYITDFFSSYFSFFVLVLCFVLVMSFSVFNFFLFFLFFEISLLPTLMIILGWGYQPERLQASFYMMMYTIVGSLPFLGLLFFSVKNMVFSFSFFYSWGFASSLGFPLFFFLFSVLAFLIKLPVYGTHLWLPKAHVEAPVSGSMILAGVLLKLGGYGVFRVFFLVDFFYFGFDVLVFFFILWGGVMTSVVCLRQIDLKSLVAYSSIGHMAILFCGYYVGNVSGCSGGLMMMIGHGLCSSCLFVLASMGYDLMGSRSVFLVKGMMLMFPSLAFWWFLFCSANMAAPTSLNLAAELLIFMGVLSKSFFSFFSLGLMSFFVGAYSLYLFLSFNHGNSLEGGGYFVFNGVLGYYVFFLHFFFLFFSFLLCELFIVF